MKTQTRHSVLLLSVSVLVFATAVAVAIHAQQGTVSSSYGPTNQTLTFEQIKAERLAVKAERAEAHAKLLRERYNLEVKTDPSVRMSGGKPVPVGPTARLSGISWEQLGQMTPEQIREKGLFPYKPLPFPDHSEGGMLFPEMTLKVLPRLTRFDRVLSASVHDGR